jgi:hypothetical protein
MLVHGLLNCRFFGSTFGNIVVAVGVMGLLWTMLNFRIERVTDSDSDTDTETDTGRAAAAGSRLEDPKVRAEMERRWHPFPPFFLDFLILLCFFFL